MIDLSILDGLTHKEKTNQLVKIAEEYANNSIGRTHTSSKYLSNEIYCTKWNKCFHNKVDELKRQAGLIKW